jgi:hypothetical protein
MDWQDPQFCKEKRLEEMGCFSVTVLMAKLVFLIGQHVEIDGAKPYTSD